MAIANQHLLTSNLCIAAEIDLSNNAGNLMVIDFTSDPVQKISGSEETSSNLEHSEITVKQSQSLVVITLKSHLFFIRQTGRCYFQQMERKFTKMIFFLDTTMRV